MVQQNRTMLFLLTSGGEPKSLPLTRSKRRRAERSPFRPPQSCSSWRIMETSTSRTSNVGAGGDGSNPVIRFYYLSYRIVLKPPGSPKYKILTDPAVHSKNMDVALIRPGSGDI